LDPFLSHHLFKPFYPEIELILTMGALVLIIVLAILLPIFELNTLSLGQLPGPCAPSRTSRGQEPC
jgi:hypothetical protein